MMKKTLSLLAGIALAGCVFTGCVEDSQNVILKGITPDCEMTSEDQTYKIGCGLTGNDVQVHVMNHITGQTPWSSSGSSSGSGATYQPNVTEQGLIYVDEIIMKCEEIDGSKDACNGKDPIKRKLNFSVKGGGGACLGFDLDQAAQWGGNTIFVSIQVSYHDPSKISGKTGIIYVQLDKNYAACIPQSVKDQEGSTPTTPTTDPDPSNKKKAKGETCTDDVECESGKCVESVSPDGMTAVWTCE